MASNEQGLRLLSLGEHHYADHLRSSKLMEHTDGEGIRGISEFITLEEVMNRIKHKEKLEFVPHPTEYFDLIGWISIGGLVSSHNFYSNIAAKVKAGPELIS
jgi:hypothetical protein